jgi:hypothetical protein
MTKIRIMNILIAVLYIIALYAYINYDQKTTLHCGEVVNTGSVSRGRSSSDLYLAIKFEKLGVKVLNVTPETYFSTSVGDSVCFELTENQEKGDTRPELIWWQEVLLLYIILVPFYFMALLLWIIIPKRYEY